MSKRSVSATAIMDSIQRLAKQDPEAFGTLFVQVTLKLSQVDRGAYDWFMAGMIVRTSEAYGVTPALTEVKQKLEANDIQGAIGALKPIESWADVMEHLASGEALLEQQRTAYVM